MWRRGCWSDQQASPRYRPSSCYQLLNLSDCHTLPLLCQSTHSPFLLTLLPCLVVCLTSYQLHALPSPFSLVSVIMKYQLKLSQDTSVVRWNNYFEEKKTSTGNSRDVWPFRYIIRMIRLRNLTNQKTTTKIKTMKVKMTMTKTMGFLTVFENYDVFDNWDQRSQQSQWPLNKELHGME